MKYLRRFSKWSTNNQLIVSSNALNDAKHSFIDILYIDIYIPAKIMIISFL